MADLLFVLPFVDRQVTFWLAAATALALIAVALPASTHWGLSRDWMSSLGKLACAFAPFPVGWAAYLSFGLAPWWTYECATGRSDVEIQLLGVIPAVLLLQAFASRAAGGHPFWGPAARIASLVGIITWLAAVALVRLPLH